MIQKAIDRLSEQQIGLDENNKIYWIAELEKKKAIEKAEKLEKQLRMQNPDATEFKRLFEQLQGDLVNLMKALSKVKASDPELAVKFENAVQVLLKTHIKES